MKIFTLFATAALLMGAAPVHAQATLPAGQTYAHWLVTQGDQYGGTAYAGCLSQLAQMRRDGIKVAVGDILTNPSFAAAPVQAADALGGAVKFAAEIDNSAGAQAQLPNGTLISATVSAIEGYIDSVTPLSKHPGVAHVGNKVEIWLYGGQQLAPSDWSAALAQVRAGGYSIYVVGPLGANLYSTQSFPSSTISSYVTLWEAAYPFLPIPSQYRTQTLALMTSLSEPLIDCEMPCYTRAGANFKLPPDDGTNLLAAWTQTISDHCVGAVVTSWNDPQGGDGSAIIQDARYEAICKAQSALLAASWSSFNSVGAAHYPRHVVHRGTTTTSQGTN